MQAEGQTERITPAEASRHLLTSLMEPGTVLVGVGHILRGDDGVGPALIEALHGRCSCLRIDAGTAPENYLGQIVKLKPLSIVFVDAVEMKLPPGEWRVFQAQDLAGFGFHTHSIPLGLLVAFLRAQTQAPVYVLGIQPRCIALGEPLSLEVSDALRRIAEIAAI